MTKYLGTENNGLEIGIDIDKDGAKDIYVGFYYNKTGKYAGIIALVLGIVFAAWQYFQV
jgi:hypothetical protein